MLTVSRRDDADRVPEGRSLHGAVATHLGFSLWPACGGWGAESRTGEGHLPEAAAVLQGGVGEAQGDSRGIGERWPDAGYLLRSKRDFLTV